MKYLVCSVRDLATHEYKGLTLEPNEYSALRSFQSSVHTSCNRNEGLLFSHPEDFELHVLAEFDSSTGELTVVKCYRLVDALDVYPDQDLARNLRLEKVDQDRYRDIEDGFDG